MATDRGGVHGISSKGAPTGATAAIRSESSQARRWLILPPLENPVAYTRFVSNDCRSAKSSSSCFIKPTSSTFVALATFVLLLRLAAAAGLLGIWLAVIVVPAFLRYLTMIAEARARGTEAETPGIEFFTLGGSLWTLFPVVPILAAAFLVRWTGEMFGDLPAIVVALGLMALLPAMIGALIITHSPLQSLNPRTIDRFIRCCGVDYWYAPATAMLIVFVPALLGSAPIWAQIIVEIYFIAVFFAVIGAITRQANLVDDVDVPASVEPDVGSVLAQLERKRTGIVLSLIHI